MPVKVAAKPNANVAALPAPLETYLKESQRPLASLAFVIPLLVLYEGGVVILGPSAVRNGADVWLRQFLDTLGFSQYFLLPALTIGLLLAWHYVARERWKLSAGVVYGMLAESAVLGLMLVAVARIEGMVAASALQSGPYVDPNADGQQVMLQQVTMTVPWIMAGRGAFLGRMLGYVGAGVYEEMLFRLLLVPPLAQSAKHFGAPRAWGIAAVVLLTSLVFSGAHYIGPHGDAFDTFTFLFRFTAGAFFAVLFVFRGFGIAAGTHALYDIFVSLS
jgi:hypothetical protein